MLTYIKSALNNNFYLLPTKLCYLYNNKHKNSSKKTFNNLNFMYLFVLQPEYILFIERKKIRSRSSVLGPDARKNLSVIESYTRTV